jgi:hypothetical protein
MKKIISFILSFFLLLSCANKKNQTASDVEVINLQYANNEHLNLRKPIIKVIKLEKTKNSLLRNIQKAYIDTLNNKIFLLSHFNLFIFDANGKYITKLKTGKGPGEILQLSSFAVNPGKQTLCVLDRSCFLCEYDYSGNFIKRNQLEKFYSKSLYYADNDHLFLTCNYVGKSEKNYVGCYSFAERRIIRKYISSDFCTYPISSNLMIPNNFIKKDDELYFISPDIFGLFKYDGDDFDLFYHFDPGKKRVPDNLAKTLLSNSRSAFRERAKKQNYIPNLLYVNFYDNHIMVGLDDDKFSCYVFNPNNPKKVFYNENITHALGLPDIKTLRLPIDNSNNSMVFACNPVDLFQEAEDFDTKTVNIGDQRLKVSIDDNPVLVCIN